MLKIHSPLAALSLVLFAGLSACGGDTDTVDQTSSSRSSDDTSTQRSESEQGAIIESGFGQQDEYVWAVALVENRSDHGGQTVTVSFNVKDESGEVVATGSQLESFTGAGQQVAIGTQISLDRGVDAASVDATLLVEDENTFEESDLEFEPMVAEVKKGEYGGFTARYAVENPTSEALQDLRIGIVCKDKSGNVNGGGIEFPDLVPPSGEILAESDVMTSGVPESCTAYISPGGM